MVRIAWLLSAAAGLVNGLADTDTITWGGDNSRAGYQENHNLDPSVVRSSQFGQLWRTLLPGRFANADERVFSQPLVYTPDDRQFIYTATTQNNVYKLDALTGEIVLSRNLHIPFLTEDLDGCTDINPTVGVTGTGVIDPETGTYYLLAKTYEDQTQPNVAQGRPAGRYYLHAIDVNDLSERPNFPVGLEGSVARNSAEQVFNGGIHLQRPGLLQQGNRIYAGFGSHCVKFNFTGAVFGWDKTTGEQIEHFATQGEGVTDEGAGIWMGGGGLAADDAGSIFYATGNGYASQLAEIPVNGREPPTALEQAVVHMSQQEDGTLEVVDFFMPWDKQRLDAGDIDLGSSPLQILPSDPFSCGDVRRIGMVTGKDHVTYWLNLDDLGGYRQGTGVSLDKVIQSYKGPNSVYAGAGVYPLEGGYVYVNPVSFPTMAFQFACTNGVPSFSMVGRALENNGGTVGVSHGTVTSLNGQPGTGLLWTTDINHPPGQLRIYDPVPRDGVLEMLRMWEIPGINKFGRAVFGDGILYMGSNNGYIHAYGAPVKTPIDCTSPHAFGSVEIQSSGEPETLTCTAVIGVQISSIKLRDEEDFSIAELPTLPLTLAAGQSFTISATFSPRQIGFITNDIAIDSTNSQEGFRTTTSIRLTGDGFSQSPSLSISPRSISFDNVIVGSSNVAPQTVLIRNRGNSALTVSEIRYSTAVNGTYESFDPSQGDLTVGPFTIGSLPTTIDANSDVSATVAFDPINSGTFGGHIRIISDGGDGDFTLSGRSGPAPQTLIEFQALDESGWVTYETGQNFTFGNVTENTTKSLRMRITNSAPPGSVRLSLTVSKPPFGSGLIRAVNQIDLGEGTHLGPGESATAVIYCSVPRRQWNLNPYDATAFWFMNTNDPTFLYHNIQFACNAVSPQAPPLLDNGIGQYQYIGCFKESTPRQLENQLYSIPDNTIAKCIDACVEKDLIFCGTQYLSECWAGNNLPTERVDDNNCNYHCSGDLNQVCGGNGVRELNGGIFISLFADTLRFDGEETNLPPLPEPVDPVVNPGVGGFESVGCYTEVPGRTLPALRPTEEQTVAACIDACSTAGYSFAGLEYGGECWCGNAIAEAAQPAGADECAMPCNDNRSELCGGPDRLNIYQRDPDSQPEPPVTSSIIGNSTAIPSSPVSAPSSAIASPTSSEPAASSPVETGPAKTELIGEWEFQGCYTEGDGVRALGEGFLADDDMTLEMCAQYCKGSRYFGAQYSRECFCGSTIAGGADLAANQDDCNMVCAGDTTQYCGAGNRLELYIDTEFEGEVPASSAVSSTVAEVSSAFSAAPSATSDIPSDATSAIPSTSDIISADSSAPAASDASSAISSAALSSTEQSAPIITSSTLPEATSLPPIASSTTIADTPATPSVYPGNEDYVYAGCYSEPEPGRLLQRQPLNDGDKMSIDLCIATCEGSNFAGVEYGRECWCGERLNVEGDPPAEGVARPGELLEDAECGFACPGDGSQFCGAGVRMSVYVLRALAGESAAVSGL
ncbi:WSC domain-containing protein [Plectosphaerella cucumerina]|uniref:WSC domain-containing protein n=1 Tax=Plectosphaerella cucumerina TaxID=40658 RepID=A0A8K0X6D3_9PEZI|nr:WSC domain-containing protein [Plectosphaerella cucumerina]